MDRQDIVNHLLTNGDMSKRQIAKEFDVTPYEALEAKKRAEFEKCWTGLGPKIAYFDLETTGLRPEMGSILCCSVLTYPSGDWHDFSINDYEIDGLFDDGELARDIRDALELHHIIVGWNSKGFDVPFLNTRLAYAGDRKLKTHLHIDPMYYYRGWHGIKPTSSSLKSVAEFWRLPTQKMHVEKDVWIRANGGDKKAIAYLSERARSDVELTAMVTAKSFEAGLIKNIQMYA